MRQVLPLAETAGVAPVLLARPTEAITTTRVITYTYDPLGRLVEADYSTGESFEYQYDAVGNRTAMTTTEGTTLYTYDAANRLTSVDGVTYTWDARGNLTHDGTFTYTYNSAGRMVRAESVTSTLVYTYNAGGLRVAQSVDGDVTTFAWDAALLLAQVLATSDDVLNLYGPARIGEVRDGEWAYSLGDALGSVRQWADGGGDVTCARGFTPQYAQAHPILGPLFGTNELDIAGSLGSFRLDVELTGDLNRHSGWWTTKTDADLEVHVVILDIYDWHAGLGAQWEGNGISDEWAQGLVDNGMAAIFLVRGDHTYTVKKTLSKPIWGVGGSPPSGWYWASYIGSQFEITSFTGGPERVDYEGNPMK